MKPKKNSRGRPESLCAEVHEDDGLDPKDFFRPISARHADNRKARQLCSQVADTLNLVLSGECGDEVLQNLQVLSVEPAPDASQLLVVLAPAVERLTLDAATVLTHLTGATGRLRSEVAATITRRRTPKLLFRLVGFPTGKEGRP